MDDDVFLFFSSCVQESEKEDLLKQRADVQKELKAGEQKLQVRSTYGDPDIRILTCLFS